MDNNFNDIILSFSKDLIEKVDGLVKSIILFGSYVENKENEKSDIDLLIIIDDVYAKDLNITVPFYFDNLNKILTDEKYKKIHVTTLTLSKFWEMILNGDPLVLDILRKGEPIIDPAGIFGSLKKMLENGLIKTSPEYLEIMKKRAKEGINYANLMLIKAFESLYNSVVTISQYYLIKNNINIYSPEDILHKFEELKKKRKISSEVYNYYKRVYEYMKKIEHREIRNVDLDLLKEFLNGFEKYKEKLNI
ncbi:MAG: nucleotidyltransferase domain-containing protein [Candidatus Nanopusillus sp.]